MLKFRTVALVGAMLLLASLLLASAPASAEDKTTIGVSLPQDDNPFYIGMLKGIRARAGELGFDVATVSSNEDKLKQINGVQDLAARGVKGILISPRRRRERCLRCCGCGENSDRIAGARLDLAEPDHPCGDGRSSSRPRHRRMDGEEARWQRQGGDAARPERRANLRNLAQGYTEVMAKYPDIQIVFKNDGPLTRERGLKNSEDAPVANPDLKAIYAANDDLALGAMQAVLAANRGGQTIVTGMNGVPPALRAVKEGSIAMTVELNPVLWGRLGVDVLATFLKGDKVEPRVFIKHVVIDSSNVDEVLAKMAPPKS